MRLRRNFKRPPHVSIFLLSLLLASQGYSQTQSQELEVIEVEGELLEPPTQVTGSSNTVSPERLEVKKDDNIQKVLLEVPGVQIRGEDGFGLRPNIGIRGTSPERSAKVALTEDGILFGPAPYSAPAAYYFPMVTRMHKVEVIKGGAQLRFGPNAMGGAVNLVTAPIQPKGWGAYVDLGVGGFNYHKAHGRVSYGAEQTGFLLEAVHVDTTGFKELDSGGNTGFNKNEFMAKWRINTKQSARVFQQLDIKLGLSLERSNETYLGLTDADFRDNPYRRYIASEKDQMNWHRGQFQATHTLIVDDIDVKTTLYRHEFTRDWYKVDSFVGSSLSDVLSDPDSPRNSTYYDILRGVEESSNDNELLIIADNYRWYTSQGLQSILGTEFDTGSVQHQLEAGVRLHHDQVHRRHTANPQAMTLEGLVDIGEQDRITTLNRGRAYAVAAHLVDEMQIKKLTLTPGARVEVVFTQFDNEVAPDLSNDRTQVGILPGMGAHYQFNQKLGLFGGVYTGFGPNSPQSLSQDNPLPKPERSVIYELGSRLNLKHLGAEVVGFFNDYSNLNAECTQSIGCNADAAGTQFSGGKVHVYGLEASLAADYRTGDWYFPARASYSFTQSSFRTEFDSTNPAWGDVKVGYELPYVPKHQGSLSLSGGMEKYFSVDLSATFVGASREVAGDGELLPSLSTDAFTLMTVGLRAQPAPSLWLYAKLDNALDQGYLMSRRPFGARPGAPRWFQTGVTYNY